NSILHLSYNFYPKSSFISARSSQLHYNIVSSLISGYLTNTQQIFSSIQRNFSEHS
ncbi:hypothetical protein GIB67_015229, partial [Kingdonia uniflora]